MEYYSSHINKLIEQLSRLPGIGAKSAQRLAFHILNMPKDQVEQLSASIVNAKANVQYCKNCYTLTDQEICPICNNPRRNRKVIMVVENTRDLAHTRRPESMTVCITCCTARSLPCWASVRMTLS